MTEFHPIVAEWFERRFASPTLAQARAWPVLQSDAEALISAPTGSGKTLAAFLACLDRLVRAALDGTLEPRIDVLYVSPLKALSNDIQKNLDAPLAEIAALASERGTPLPAIRTAVRTGDTTSRERQQMMRQPPHILVTTPESLFILLTAERSRDALRRVRTVIVDEIHAVVDDKRGAHLSLSLARLDDLVEQAGGRAPQRIGLSATVRPIEAVARYLSPSREVTIVDTGHRRAMDVAIEVPRDELGAVASNEMWAEIYDRLADWIRSHRTTLVFVNTRRLAERVSHRLTERLGEHVVLAHHGSLSRALRLNAEQRLKRGDLRAVVATASLELGIDIGSVDLVCQIGSPRAIGTALQRIGRSGHQADAASTPKGRIFATTRDDLIESAALVKAIRGGALDQLEIPAWPRDVLAQQIVATAACEAASEDALFGLVRRAFSYRDLPRAEFDAIIDMLSEGIATGRGRRGAYLHRDRVNGIVRGRRGARLAALTSGGAIPDNANFLVVVEPDGAVVGTVDEDFAVESLAGDVFVLGTASWRIKRIEAGRVRVEDAHGAAPTIPFWNGEAPGRTPELSYEVSRVREEILRRPDREAVVEFLLHDCGVDRRGAEQAIDYVRHGAAALGALPTDRTVVAERFFDEGGGMQLVLHAPFGARINRAWGLALRKRFCRSFNFELQAAATDNGIVISLSEQHSFALDAVFRFLSLPTLEEVLTQAMLDAPMFEARWRWNAARALAVLRFTGGRKVPPPIQRMRSDDLLAAVFPDQAACGENLVGDIRIPDHPLVNETIRDCLHEAMDFTGLQRVIDSIWRGDLRTVAVDTPEPSPFSHEILNANPYAFLDDAPLEERRTRAVQLRRTLPADAREVGALDPRAIAAVAQESWPVVRDADELHDALLTLVVLPPVPQWTTFFCELARMGRATRLVAGDVGNASLWVSAERLAAARLLYRDAVIEPVIAAAGDATCVDREAAATEAIRGWLESTGPATASALAARLGLAAAIVDAALARLESSGEILRGRFAPRNSQLPSPNAQTPNLLGSWELGIGTSEIEWCNRRLLARIHRLTIGRLRREIEPVSAADFVRFLFRWQHVAPGTQLHGVDGLLYVLEQLQGYEISTSAWERDVLPSRVARYTPELLDRVCLSGDAMWGRLSPHPAFTGRSGRSGESTGRSGKKNEDFTGRSGRSGRTSDLSNLAELPDLPVNNLPELPDPPVNDARRVRPTRVAPMAIVLRDDAQWLLDGVAQPDTPGGIPLTRAAQHVLDVLQRRGASFLRELITAARLPRREAEDALWELASAGLVTADGFDNLRHLIDPKRRRGEGRSSARRGHHVAGRWALLSVAGDAPRLSPEERADRFARQLLLRWGVVFRDLLARETLAPAWRDLLLALRRMEARGDVRGGRFVAGFVGEQFARPDALDALRALRRVDGLPPQELPRNRGSYRIAAADPLNLAGIITPGPRVSALAGQPVDLPLETAVAARAV